MVLDAALTLGRLGAGLGEVEDERASGEGELVTVVEGVDKVTSLICRFAADGTIALRALQVELQEQREFARLERAVWAILWRALRVVVVRQHLLALANLLCDSRLEHVILREVANARIALHLDEAARDRYAW